MIVPNRGSLSEKSLKLNRVDAAKAGITPCKFRVTRLEAAEVGRRTPRSGRIEAAFERVRRFLTSRPSRVLSVGPPSVFALGGGRVAAVRRHEEVVGVAQRLAVRPLPEDRAEPLAGSGVSSAQQLVAPRPYANSGGAIGSSPNVETCRWTRFAKVVASAGSTRSGTIGLGPQADAATMPGLRARLLRINVVRACTSSLRCRAAAASGTRRPGKRQDIRRWRSLHARAADKYVGSVKSPCQAPNAEEMSRRRRHLRAIDEREALHRQRRNDRQSDAGRAAASGHRQRHRDSGEAKGRRQHRGPRERDTERAPAAGEAGARQVDDWRRPMTSTPAAMLLTARTVTASRENPSAVSALPGKQLGATARAREHGRPGAVAILGREQVAADDARHRGKAHNAANPQDDQRRRKNPTP